MPEASVPGGGQRAPLLAAGERPHGEPPVCVPADSAPSCLPVAPPPSSLVVGAPAHRAVKMVRLTAPFHGTWNTVDTQRSVSYYSY